VRGRAPWVAMAAVLAVALAIGGWPHGSPSIAQRERSLAGTIRCPSCRSQSVADSDTPAAKALRAEIHRRVASGQTDDQVRDYIVGRSGEDLLLEPPRSGIGGLVWAIPVVAAVLAFVAIGFRFRQWRPGQAAPVSAEDRALVDAARRRVGGRAESP